LRNFTKFTNFAKFGKNRENREKLEICEIWSNLALFWTPKKVPKNGQIPSHSASSSYTPLCVHIWVLREATRSLTGYGYPPKGGVQLWGFWRFWEIWCFWQFCEISWNLRFLKFYKIFY